jgi:hypothetical protein
MPRRSINRKYRPRFENLESKQLLSGGLLGHGPQMIVQNPPPVSLHVVHQGIRPDGTGKTVVIITS